MQCVFLLVYRAILLNMQCVFLQQLHCTWLLRYLVTSAPQNFCSEQTKMIWLTLCCTIIQQNSFELLSFVVVGIWRYASDSRKNSWTPTGPRKRGGGARYRKDCKLLRSCMLPLHQHSQWKAELGKHLLSGAIFLMLISLIARTMWGEMCIRSIRLTFGASRIAFGGDNAYWIAQMARGRMYTSDR